MGAELILLDMRIGPGLLYIHVLLILLTGDIWANRCSCDGSHSQL